MHNMYTQRLKQSFDMEERHEWLAAEKSALSVHVCNAVLLGMALFMVFVGYRYFKTSVAFQGAILGGFLGWLLGKLIAQSAHNSGTQEAIQLTVAASLGLLTAMMTLCFRKIMLFVFGFSFGLQVASVVNVLFLHRISSTNPNTVGYVVMTITSLVFGLLTCCATKFWFVILTSFVGSYWAMQAIGHFAGNFPDLFEPFKKNSTTLPLEYFGYIAGAIALGFLGTYVQFMCTAQHVDHSHLHRSHQDDDEDEDDIAYHKLKG